MAKTLGIVGLGRMGMAAARRFAGLGWEVWGYDPRPEAAEELDRIGGRPAGSAREVAERASLIIVYVLNDAQVLEAVCGDEGVLAGVGDESVVICSATIDRDTLESVARRCTDRGVGFIDCPVTGGPARLEQGTLTLMAAAPMSLIDSVREVLETEGRIVHIGETPGLGQAVKHCNQLLVGTTQAAVMEVITLARRSGLDPGLVCDVVGSGIAGSDWFRLIADGVLEERPSVSGLGQMIKDVGLVMSDAERTSTPLPVASAAYQYFLAARSLGLEGSDATALIQVLERMTES